MIGPDGQPMGAVPASALAARTTRRQRRRRGRRARADRPRGAARQGDADREHDPPAARGGEGRSRSTRPAGPASRRSTRPRSRSSRPGWRRSWSRSWSGCRCRSPRTPRRPRASCGSRRPSWSAGWRACSTASRPRSTPSRWPLAPSSSRSGGRCRPGQSCPAGRRRPAGSSSSRRGRASPAGCTSRTTPPPLAPRQAAHEQQAQQAHDHQRRPGSGESAERLGFGVRDLRELRCLRLRRRWRGQVLALTEHALDSRPPVRWRGWCRCTGWS